MTSKNARFFGWKAFLGNRPYQAALEWQRRMVRYRYNGTLRDTLLYLEHPHVITVGRDHSHENLLQTAPSEVHQINRGGGVTYHGPGQLMVYPIFDLGRRGKDLRHFVSDLEEGIIQVLFSYGLPGARKPGYTGVWVAERKIASVGIAVTQWISYHGAAINLTTDLERFKAINPCGLPPEIMTSTSKELGQDIGLEEFASRLSDAYQIIFDTDFEKIELEELAEIIRAEESTQSL